MKDSRARLGKIDDDFLRCRVRGHSWRSWRARRNGSVFEQQLRCSECGSTRHETLSTSGELVKVRIEYVDGYIIEGLGFLDKKDRGQLRLREMRGMKS